MSEPLSVTPKGDQTFDGDAFLIEIRSEVERIARALEQLSKDMDRLKARFAGRWPQQPDATSKLPENAMITIHREHYRELHPETKEDIAKLRRLYPHCFPCEYVCVAETQQMEQEYGQSGCTRSQIIRDYEEHERRINSAVAWVKERL